MASPAQGGGWIWKRESQECRAWIALAATTVRRLLLTVTNEQGGEVRRPNRWGRYAIAAGLAALMVLIFRPSGDSELERRFARYRAAGEPVTLEELNAWYPQVPDGSNGATRLINALSKLREEPAGRIPGKEKALPMPTADEALDPELVAALKVYVTTNASVTAELRAALRMPFRYPFEFKSASDELEGWRASKTASRHFSILALEASGRGDAPQSLTALEDGYLAAATLAEAPTLIVQLIRIATESMNHSALEGALNRVAFDDPQLRRLEAIVSALPELSACNRRALAGERVLALCAFSDLESRGAAASAIKKIPWMAFKTLGAFRRDRFRVLDGIDLLLTLERSAETNVPAAKTAFAQWLKPQPRFLSPLSHMFLPAMERGSFDRTARNQTLRHCARVALAAQRFRLARGEWPTLLDELVPTYLPIVPIDPWSNQPLRWVREPSGFVVYSVGDDLRDDRGDERRDIRFKVRRTEP
jgi:hypothetical protein